jgi:hypothetical protein
MANKPPAIVGDLWNHMVKIIKKVSNSSSNLVAPMGEPLRIFSVSGTCTHVK